MAARAHFSDRLHSALRRCTGARAAETAALERGTAITDPATLRELDGGRFRLDRMLLPERSADAPLTNSELFALPSMTPVRQAIDGEFDRYIAGTKRACQTRPSASATALISSCSTARCSIHETRFVLAGIVNRMDRAYVAEADCGEIRLIYRLTRIDMPDTGDNASSPRLPMTLNLVLKAKGDRGRSQRQAITCSEIASRWLARRCAALRTRNCR